MSDAPVLVKPHAALPAWHPDWARELAELYFSGTTCLFVLHGNVHDLIRCPRGQSDHYCNLTEFLSSQVFGSWDVVLQYDLGRGLRPLPGGDPARLQSMMQFLAGRLGDPAGSGNCGTISLLAPESNSSFQRDSSTDS